MAKQIDKFKASGKMETTISGKLLYMLLDEMADGDGAVIISHRRVAKILGIHKATVSKNLRRLESNGEIMIRDRRTKDGGRLANEYIVR